MFYHKILKSINFFYLGIGIAIIAVTSLLKIVSNAIYNKLKNSLDTAFYIKYSKKTYSKVDNKQQLFYWDRKKLDSTISENKDFAEWYQRELKDQATINNLQSKQIKIGFFIVDKILSGLEFIIIKDKDKLHNTITKLENKNFTQEDLKFFYIFRLLNIVRKLPKIEKFWNVYEVHLNGDDRGRDTKLLVTKAEADFLKQKEQEENILIINKFSNYGEEYPKTPHPNQICKLLLEKRDQKKMDSRELTKHYFLD